MRRRVATHFLILLLSVACTSLPHGHRRTPLEVVEAHLAGLNRCDFESLMALYPPDVHLFLPGGKVVKGREAVAEVYRQTVKPFKDGGVCGLKFSADVTFPVGDTVNVQWRVTSDMLAAPYLGADAYVTKDGMMWCQVTTWDRSAIKAR